MPVARSELAGGILNERQKFPPPWVILATVGVWSSCCKDTECGLESTTSSISVGNTYRSLVVIAIHPQLT